MFQISHLELYFDFPTLLTAKSYFSLNQSKGYTNCLGYLDTTGNFFDNYIVYMYVHRTRADNVRINNVCIVQDLL